MKPQPPLLFSPRFAGPMVTPSEQLCPWPTEGALEPGAVKPAQATVNRSCKQSLGQRPGVSARGCRAGCEGCSWGLCLPPSCPSSVLIQSTGSHWDHKDRGHTLGKWKETRLLTTLHNHPEMILLSSPNLLPVSFHSLQVQLYCPPRYRTTHNSGIIFSSLFLSSDSRSFSTSF